MNRFIIYIRLRLKTVLKIFPSMCIMTLLLCLSLGGMLYLQSARSLQMSEGDEDATVSIGIAGVDDSGAFSAAFPALLKLDSSRSEVDFVMYDTKQDAVKAIRKGEILAAIVFPDGVVSSLLAGGVDRMVVVVPASSAGLEALILKELSRSVSTILGSHEQRKQRSFRLLCRIGNIGSGDHCQCADRPSPHVHAGYAAS